MSMYRHTDGFTLVETLVAVTILLFAILGPMTIASQGIRASNYARQQATAVFLAQDAIESLVKLRNADALAFRYGAGTTWAWLGILPADCKNSVGCDYDRESNYYHSCGPTNACLLEINPNATSDGYKYAYRAGGPAWKKSIFTRKIFINEIQPGEEVQVRVEVSWEGPFDNQKVVTQTSIFDHYDF